MPIPCLIQNLKEGTDSNGLISLSRIHPFPINHGSTGLIPVAMNALSAIAQPRLIKTGTMPGWFISFIRLSPRSEKEQSFCLMAFFSEAMLKRLFAGKSLKRRLSRESSDYRPTCFLEPVYRRALLLLIKKTHRQEKACS